MSLMMIVLVYNTKVIRQLQSKLVTLVSGQTSHQPAGTDHAVGVGLVNFVSTQPI